MPSFHTYVLFFYQFKINFDDKSLPDTANFMWLQTDLEKKQ